jgi:hypothetical protein
VSDGRGLPRGEAAAVRARCIRGRLAKTADRVEAEGRLAAWRVRQRPDTALARAEERIAFSEALLETPVHALSLMNYRIAEFACLRGRPPDSIAELRAAHVAEDRDSATNWLGDRVWQDAWERPILYQRRGQGYEVRSVGRDGRPGTADDLVGVDERMRIESCGRRALGRIVLAGGGW